MEKGKEEEVIREIADYEIFFSPLGLGGHRREGGRGVLSGGWAGEELWKVESGQGWGGRQAQ